MYNGPNLEPMQVVFYLAGEITQFKESISWVRCASGNVLLLNLSKSLTLKIVLLNFCWNKLTGKTCKTQRVKYSLTNVKNSIFNTQNYTVEVLLKVFVNKH